MSEEAGDEYRELIEIHNRTFQNYSLQNSVYLIPVDEEEEERLVLLNLLFAELFEKLYFPPIDYPKRVLECGYGCGAWAVTMAQIYEESEVTAIDIFPADLPDEPDNLEREIWNLNDPMTPTYQSNQYDLVHSRCVGPGIRKDRWRNYIKDLVRLCKRGGWVQCAEWYYNIQSDSGRLKEDHYIYKWGHAYRTAMESDRDPRIGRSLADKMRDAGLTHVESRSFRVPIGDWHSDERQKSIGLKNKENLEAMLDSHAIWPFTQRLGWTAEQVQWCTLGAKAEMEDPKLKLYLPLYVAWGRKR